jgi:hypothetical protein
MNFKEELVQTVIEFLNKNKIQHYKDSIKYSGIRENMKLFDGSIKTMHVVSYMVSIADQTYDGDAFFSVFFDEKTLKMKFILGPQSLEIIEE